MALHSALENFEINYKEFNFSVILLKHKYMWGNDCIAVIDNTIYFKQKDISLDFSLSRLAQFKYSDIV